MKLFVCPACAHVVFFENTLCVACGRSLAYQPRSADFHLLSDNGSASGNLPAAGFQPCRNRIEPAACNWSVPADEGEAFCLACRLNETIPNLTTPAAREAWLRLERAKRRLLYTLFRIGLAIEPRRDQSSTGLAFAFKQDGIDGTTVVTGHADGLITINIAEADDGWRETTRMKLGEPYRTLLGHFRHESGHYYWNRLIRDGGRVDTFRALFGDESIDYTGALERYYAQGATEDWPMRFISTYASAHPWEDWAESWAHYLHMVDTVETARAYGLSLHAPLPHALAPPELDTRTMVQDDFTSLIAIWVPLTLSLNSFNRGLGLNDAYPFAPSETVIAKLRLIDEIIRAGNLRNQFPR